MKRESPDNETPGAPVSADPRSLLNEINRLRLKVNQLEARVRELDELAHLDPLVGLPNRRGLMRDLEKLIASVDRYGGSAAMIFADVDDLKLINDRFGHETGDAALIEIARILLANARASDTVARMSGDEFVILLPNTDELGAWNMALRIVEATLASPLGIPSGTLPLCVAVGVGPVQAGDRPHDVIARADKAMYRIKAA